MNRTRLVDAVKTREPASDIRTTTCYMCACRCGIRVHLRNGAIRYIDGNPDHPINQGQWAGTMTQLALVIDLNVCVGCHACVTSCKEWNTSGAAGSMADDRPYGPEPTGMFFNRVQTFEVGTFPETQTVNFPKSCLHCEDPPCVPMCPIGCKYCSWACPYGARELDEHQKVMKKCTLCVDRIYDEALPLRERKPACVMACPTSARLFGDIHDAGSDVSKAIRNRGGYTNGGRVPRTTICRGA